MLHVFVMESAETDAVRGIEGSSALPNPDEMMHFDLAAARFAHPLQLAAILIPRAYQLACLLPAC